MIAWWIVPALATVLGLFLVYGIGSQADFPGAELAAASAAVIAVFVLALLWFAFWILGSML